MMVNDLIAIVSWKRKERGKTQREKERTGSRKKAGQGLEKERQDEI